MLVVKIQRKFCNRIYNFENVSAFKKVIQCQPGKQLLRFDNEMQFGTNNSVLKNSKDNENGNLGICTYFRDKCALGIEGLPFSENK